MRENGEKWWKVEQTNSVKQFRGFYGNYQHSLDVKGRVFVPSKFRDGLSPCFMLAKWLDGCLAAFPMSEFDEIDKKLKAIPFTNKAGRQFKDFFYNGASDCDIDKQGRINIPQDLREYAGLEKDVCIAGSSNYVKIWDYSKWKKSTDEYGENADALASGMDELLRDVDIS